MRRSNSSLWNDDNCNLLRGWWEEKGYTCGRISAEYAAIGYVVTRNMVIGKVHRMKLVPPEWKAAKLRQKSKEIMAITNIAREIMVKAKTQKQIVIRGKKYNPIRPMEVIMSESKLDRSHIVRLKDSKKGQCKFIVGYIGGRCEEACYCGNPTESVRVNGKLIHRPWCTEHHTLCVQPSRPSKFAPIYRRTSSHR